MKRPSTWKLVTIRGVELRLHISLVFLLAYVVFISALQFPLVVEQAGLDFGGVTIGPFWAGLIFALGLFASVVLHEYGHVGVAQAQGIPVNGVTLMMLGGVSEIKEVPDRPYAEFKLAIVGPLVSVGLGLLLLALHRQAITPNWSLFSYWLGSANLALGIFNLLPAFPLDGGRALRSILAARQGNVKATRTAVKISQVFAWALGLFGLVGFNLLLVLIAVFIYSASQSELMLLLTRGVLKGLRVKEVMNRVQAVSETSSLAEAASEMLKSRSRMMPVQTASGQGAILSLDVLRSVNRNQWSETSVKQVMELVPKVLDADDSISQAMGEILASPSRALPVSENGASVGILSFSDLADVVQFRSLEQSSIEGDKAA